MKKSIALIMITFMLTVNIESARAFAEEKKSTEYNGLEYVLLNDNIVELTGAVNKEVTSLLIPESFDGKEIVAKEGVFCDCPNLTEINVDNGNPTLCSIDGVLFNKEGTLLISYPRGLNGEYTIPDGTQGIMQEAFENSNGVTSINIPDSLTFIGAYAFKNCKSISVFSKPLPLSSGDSIEECSSLKSISLIESDKPITINNLKFNKCFDLEEINIPRNYIINGSFVVSECPKIEQIQLPYNASDVNIIISKCDALTSVNLPIAFSDNKSSVNIEQCKNVKELTISDVKNITIKNMPLLKTVRFISPIYKISEDSQIIDYETCQNLEDIYFYSRQAGSLTVGEATLIAQNDITVHCSKDDTDLQVFLDNYKIKTEFIENEQLCGDANCDGQIDMADVVLIMQALANPNKYDENGRAEIHLTTNGKSNADINGDGLTVKDAQIIQKYLLKIVPVLFPGVE